MIVLASIACVLCSCTAASAPGVTTTTGIASVTAVGGRGAS